MKRILVIGGAGYIGTVLTQHLLESGFSVRSLDLFLYQNETCLQSLLDHENYESMCGDLCGKESLHRALDGVTDVVLLAGLVGDPITKKYPEASLAINETGIRQCIDRLQGRELNQVIFISTCSNYGLIDDEVPADEGQELKPLSLYAKAKVSAEKHLLGLRGRVDYSPTILRFATAFGLSPRMRFDLTVNEFSRELALERELLVYDAHTWRPYCHVRDFARLIEKVLGAPEEQVAFEVFNAGGDANNHTKQGIVSAVMEHLPEAKVRYQDHGSDPRNYRVNFRKVREVLGFEPEYTISDGIFELLAALDSGRFADADTNRNLHGNYELSYPV